MWPITGESYKHIATDQLVTVIGVATTTYGDVVFYSLQLNPTPHNHVATLREFQVLYRR